MPAIKGEEKHTEGLQGAPAHGLGVTPDGKVLFSTSKVYSTMYAYSLPNLEPLGHVHVGQHPEWVTFSPDGTVCLRGGGRGQLRPLSWTLQTLKVVANIPVGQVPKRNGTALLRR